MPITYELMVVVDGQRSDDEIAAQLSKIDKLITDHGATITHTDDWGKRRLAYPVDGKVDGYYAVRQFTHPGGTRTLMSELDRAVRIEEALLRHIVVRLPKTKKPIPVLGRPDAGFDARPDWGGARRGWRPPRRERPDYDRDRREERVDRPEPAEAEAAPAGAADGEEV